MTVESQRYSPAILLGLSCALAWAGNTLYALGEPGSALKHFSPAIVVLGSVLFFGWHCSRRYGTKLTFFFILSVFSVGWLFETLSVLTGIPFGRYHYSDIMAPFIGHIPVFVLPAYLFMGYASWSLATLFLGIHQARLTRAQARKIPPVAAALMVIWDISMDPLRATIEGRWIWIEGGTYLGVPLSNFLGWFLVTWCMFSLFAHFTRGSPPDNASGLEKTKSFRVSIPIMYGCYAAEYLLNPFVGYGYSMNVVGHTHYMAQDIFSVVAGVTAITLVPAIIFGLWIAMRQTTFTAQQVTSEQYGEPTQQ